MNKSRFNFGDLVWGALAILAAELAWTITFYAAGAMRDRCRKTGDCLTDKPDPAAE